MASSVKKSTRFASGRSRNTRTPVEKLLAQMQQLIEQGYPLQRIALLDELLHLREQFLHRRARVARSSRSEPGRLLHRRRHPGLGAPRGHAAQRGAEVL